MSGYMSAADKAYYAGKAAAQARLEACRYHADPREQTRSLAVAMLRAEEAREADRVAAVVEDSYRRDAERFGYGLSGEERAKWFADNHVRPT